MGLLSTSHKPARRSHNSHSHRRTSERVQTPCQRPSALFDLFDPQQISTDYPKEWVKRIKLIHIHVNHIQTYIQSTFYQTNDIDIASVMLLYNIIKCNIYYLQLLYSYNIIYSHNNYTSTLINKNIIIQSYT